jgi:tetratricopeptide (TPR) repeat protein
LDHHVDSDQVGKGSRPPEPDDLQVRCIYQGKRLHAGRQEAYLRVTGSLKRRGAGGGGKLRGFALYDLERGFVSRAQLTFLTDLDINGVALALTQEIDLTRTPGNTLNIALPTGPTPGLGDAPVAKGKVLFTHTAQLTPQDARDPRKPGCWCKVFPATLSAGKKYVVEMTQAPGSTLDPFLRLEDAKGNVLAFNDDGGDNLNSMLVFVVPRSGTYRIVATTLGPNQFGAFKLTAAEAAAAATPAATVRATPRIVRDDKERERRWADKLAWQRRTLVAAYDKVGKRDPRWDEPARAALELAAQFWSQQREGPGALAEFRAAVERAVAAGCDDPLLLYLHARTAPESDVSEVNRRYRRAVPALERSEYPPFRRIVALQRAAESLCAGALPADDRNEALRCLDAALALLPKSVAQDERHADLDESWMLFGGTALRLHRRLNGGNATAALAGLDKGLDKPAFKTLRLKVRGEFFIAYAWEARGSGTADKVTQEGFEHFGARLTEAHKALAEAWRAQPGDVFVATDMLTVLLGLGGSREEVETWFERAMKAEPNNVAACEAMLNYLDPKWYGSQDEMLEFGRSCRATQNWRAGTPLLLADAHYRVAQRMSPEAQGS